MCTCIPGAGNPSAWDRYAYTLNNPLRYTDPSGHEPSTNCYDRGYCPEDPNFHTDYMGGATPAEPPGFLGDGDVPSAGGPHDPRGWSNIPDVVSEGVTLYEMYREGGDPTLKTYLTYQTDSDENVIGIDVTIKNSGASSAQLETITLTETGLPSFTTCTLNKTCYFEPDDVVNIDPGQNTSIKICQNCLANNKTIFNSFSSLFYINKNSQIEVKVTIAMLWSADGHKTTYSKVPFVYTIPWR